MKSSAIIIGAAIVACSVAATADNTLWIQRTDGITLGINTAKVDSVSLTSGGSGVTIATKQSATGATLARSEINNLTISAANDTIMVQYSDTDATVINPQAFEGVTVEKTGAAVTVRSSSTSPSIFKLSGTTGNGSFKLYTSAKSTIVLSNANITNGSGSAINLQSSESTTIEAPTGTVNTLTDAKKYSTPSGESEKGCIHSDGSIIFTGSGEIRLTSNKKHAIAGGGSVEFDGGNVTVLAAASDGIHSTTYFAMRNGSYTSTATTGDGIDADEGYINISGGTINVTIDVADTKGIKADGYINISGGSVTVNVNGDQCKGIKSKNDINISGGSVESTLKGNVVLVDADPSYCSAIKADGNFSLTGGTVKITGTGKANKGISADGAATFAEGNVTISVSGDGATYTNANGYSDSYSATCISIDSTLTITGGTFELSSSGSAGKCIKSDQSLVIGSATGMPVINAKTTGKKLTVSSSSGGWGPWGGGSSTDYANPKVIKAEGNLTINNGKLTISAANDGGEGLESKATLKIAGGDISVSTYDDCINASTHIEISGGVLRCYASGNDAIDSNGTLTLSGGVIIALGAASPECGFDCDNNRFSITGGTIIGAGGSTSTPTSSYCTQRVVSMTRSLTSGGLLTITDSSGNQIFTFTSPTGYSGSKKLIISSDKFVQGGSYKVYTGGSVTGGTTYYDLNVGGTYTPGTQATTFTTSSMVTTVNSSSGGGGGRP